MSDYSLPGVLIRPVFSAAKPAGAPPATNFNPLTTTANNPFLQVQRQKREHFGPYAIDQNRILHRYVPVPGQRAPTLYYSQTPEIGNLAPAPKTSKGVYGPYFKDEQGKLVPVAAFPGGTPGIHYYSSTDPDLDLDLAGAPEHGHIDNSWDAFKRGINDGLRNPAGWSAGNLVKAFGGSPEQIALAQRIGDSPLGEGLAQLARLAGASEEHVEHLREMGRQIERIVPAYGTVRAIGEALSKPVTADNLATSEAALVLSGLRQELGSLFARPNRPPANSARPTETLHVPAKIDPADKPRPKTFSELLVRRTGPNGKVQLGLLASPFKAPRFTEPAILHPLDFSSESLLSPARVASIEQRHDIRITHPGLTLAGAPAQYATVRANLQRSATMLKAARAKIAALPISASTRRVMETYFGNDIFDATPKMRANRARLFAHLSMMEEIHLEFLQPGGMERIALFSANLPTAREVSSAFVIEGDPRRNIFLNKDFLHDEEHSLHESAHHATLGKDFWYINTHEDSSHSWPQNDALSNAIVNSPPNVPYPKTHQFVLALVQDWPPYQAWYKRLIRSAAKSPDPEGFQAKALDDLFTSDPAIRSALAVHNPDNLAYAVLALAHESAVTPVARKETAV